MNGDHVDGVRARAARRARLELVFAVVFAVLTLLAVAIPMWIEETTGLSPDGGNGETELWLGVPFGVIAVVLAALSWRSRRRVVDATD